VKTLQGYKDIDHKIAKGGYLTSLEQLLVDARAVCPELCRGFTSTDEIINVAELMHITSYRPWSNHLAEQYRMRQMPSSKASWRHFVASANSDVIDDFRMYLSGRLWDPAAKKDAEDKAPKREVLTMHDMEGNPVDGEFIVETSDSDPLQPWQKLDPSYVEPTERTLLAPLSKELLEQLEAQLDPDRPTMGEKVGAW
jgi:hypothetical protein